MVKRFIVWGVMALGFVVSNSAQSVIKPAPTPAPQADETRSLNGYSESTPNPNRKIYTQSALRDNKNKSKSKSGTLSKNQSSNQSSPINQTTKPSSVSSDEDVLKVETNLITIPVSVYQSNGIYVSDLWQSNFKIFEDGKEQEVAYFGVSDKPFTVILLLDTSPSTAYKIEEIQNAAIAFVSQLKPDDKVLVIEFDHKVHILSEATSDRQKIYKSIRRADFGDGTSLFDAVGFSIDKRLNKIEGRKAVVLFTDGVDTTSHKEDPDSTISKAESSGALVFPIYYNTLINTQGGTMTSVHPAPGDIDDMDLRGTSSEEYAFGRKYLEELAASTGGRVFPAESFSGGLEAAFKGIAEELRSQYNIGYYPQNEGQQGQRKQIKVRVNRPNLVVRARDSYIVGEKN